MKVISNLLKYLHEYDQTRRCEISKGAGTTNRDSADDKIPFYVFEGEVEERTRVVLFLIAQGGLEEADDFYYAATLIINSGSLENFILAYKLIKSYREMGGEQPWGFKDKYFQNMSWNKSRVEVETLVEKELGVHPSSLDR